MPRESATQAHVTAAADALLFAGERPTIERVRARLGAGSPNAIATKLDRWWSELATRVRAAQAVESAPDPIHALVRDLWAAALSHARQDADAAVGAERAALAVARAALDAERQAQVIQRQAADAECQRLVVQRDEALLRLEDSGRALEDARAMTASLTVLLEQAQAQLAGSEQRADALAREFAQVSDRLEAERAAARAHDQAQAEHWAAEVDRGRSEANAARAELATVRSQEREHRRRELDAVRADARTAREVLEQQLNDAQARHAHLTREHQQQHDQLMKALAERAGFAAQCVTLQTHVRDLVRRPMVVKPVRVSKPRRRAKTAES